MTQPKVRKLETLGLASVMAIITVVIVVVAFVVVVTLAGSLLSPSLRSSRFLVMLPSGWY